MRIILAGNPNSGKTTVFNRLTGGRQHIGNFPGITIEYKTGRCGEDTIIDLPGLYSLAPHSAEEQVAVQYLKKHQPDAIINCIDITNLRRSLMLTLSLMELQIPMVIVANMLEECRPQPTLEALEQWLGIPIFRVRRQNRWAPALLMRLVRSEVAARHQPKPLINGTADEKYRFIDRYAPLPLCSIPRRKHSEKLDQILMHPLWGILIFILIMSLIFELVFRRIGPFLTAPLQAAPERLAEMAELLKPPLFGALAKGIVTGIGTVATFMPMMMLLFFFLALLEDSGYMVRICYLAENIMSKLGLSGKSIVPLLIGFGCSVPAVLSTRTLENGNQRRRTIRTIPFISCSAKLPVFGILAALIAPNHPFWLIPIIYLCGIGGGLLAAFISPREQVPLMLELPPYRRPKLINLWHRLWGQTAAFIQKAFSVLLLTAVLTTLLQQFTPGLEVAEDPSKSILAFLAGLPERLFAPLRLDHWILIAALIAGLFAKESVVSVLAVLSPGMMIFNKENLLPFLVFFLFYPPCTAALTAIRRETGSRLYAIGTFLLHFCIAWLSAFLAAQI